LSNQCVIDTAFQKLKQAYLNSANHARMDMVMAVFFYENNIFDQAIKSLSFNIMPKYAHQVSQEYNAFQEGRE
jgi:uncharacterized protein YggE